MCVKRERKNIKVSGYECREDAEGIDREQKHGQNTCLKRNLNKKNQAKQVRSNRVTLQP